MHTPIDENKLILVRVSNGKKNDKHTYPHSNTLDHEAHKINVTHNYNKQRTTQQSATTMYTDIQNSTLMEPEKKARQSYYADIFWSLPD